MISTFHPSVILCTPENWVDEKYQDKFLEDLIHHLAKIKEMRIKIAWCNEIESVLWNDPPWRHYYAEQMLIETFHEIISNSIPFDSPPDNECIMVPFIPIDLSNEVKIYWSVLIHRLIHNQRTVFIVISSDIKKEITSINVSCNCRSECEEYIYQIIKDPTEWYKKINYVKLCSAETDSWERAFSLALKMCYVQEYSHMTLKNKIENLKFSNNFKKTFTDIDNERTKKKIISSIIQRLTHTKAEAGCHSGLRDELIKGKRDEYSFRVSGVERIHYKFEDDKIWLLDYYPGSEHDSRCK